MTLSPLAYDSSTVHPAISRHDRRAKGKQMKLKTTTLLVSLLTLAVTFGAMHARAEDAAAGGVLDVAALWKKNCASCHGEDGKGQTKAGKQKKVEDLTNPEVRAKFDRDRMIKSIKDGIKDDAGKDRMKPFAEKLSDAEIAALVDYTFDTLK
jgi:mono/diheme cytochrome c family protein